MVKRDQPVLESATMPDDQADMLALFAEMKRLQGASADMPDDPRELAGWLASVWNTTGASPMIALRQPSRTPAARRHDRDQARTVSRCSFARLVALHCRLSGFETEPRDLDQWLAAVWPMVEEQGMDPARWARAYMVACGLV
jgi:hypothetical protein